MVANGGVFVWKDERENPDTCVAAVTYPKGFLYTYKTTFGNSYRGFTRIQGRDGTIVCYGGEGATLYTVSKEGGRHEIDTADSEPIYTKVPLVAPASEHEEVIQVPGAPPGTSLGTDDDDPEHMFTWLKAMQTRTEPGRHRRTTVSPIPLFASWRRSRTGAAKGSTGILRKKKSWNSPFRRPDTPKHC